MTTKIAEFFDKAERKLFYEWTLHAYLKRRKERQLEVLSDDELKKKFYAIHEKVSRFMPRQENPLYQIEVNPVIESIENTKTELQQEEEKEIPPVIVDFTPPPPKTSVVSKVVSKLKFWKRKT